MARVASESSSSLRGRLLLLIRLAWLALMIPTVVLTVLSQIEFAKEPLPDCRIQECEDPFDFTLQDLPLLEQEGLTFFVYSGYELVFAIPLLVTYLLVAVVIWRRSDDWVALLVTFTLASTVGLMFTSADDALLRRYPALDTLVATLQSSGILSLVALLFVFPDGRLVPDRPRLALIGAIVLLAVAIGGLLMPSAGAAPGCTPYVQNEAELSGFLDRFERYFDFFFGEIGGRAATPEYIRALLTPDPRQSASRV